MTALLDISPEVAKWGYIAMTAVGCIWLAPKVPMAWRDLRAAYREARDKETRA